MSEPLTARDQVTLIVFQQQLRVQLVNVSRSGCLLQASRPVRVGTVGRLRVALDDMEYADDVRVARCASGKGANCELGVELLWVPKPQEARSDAPSLALMLSASGEDGTSARLQATGT
jgi:PilZ domain